MISSTHLGGTGGKHVSVTTTQSTTIDYDVHGEGSPLVLINGLGFRTWAFFKQVPALSRHFSTITFDVREERNLKGGVADLAADTLALLDHLGVRKAHVLGASLGGFVAQHLALERPDLVERWSWWAPATAAGGPRRRPHGRWRG